MTGSSSHAFWWEKTVLHSMETLFDVGLVALESISPRKGSYYSTLRCCTLPSKVKSSQGSDQLHGFCDRFSLVFTVPHFPSHQGAWPELPVITLNMICILSNTPQSRKHLYTLRLLLRPFLFGHKYNSFSLTCMFTSYPHETCNRTCLAFYITFTRAPANFTWAQARV